MTRSNRRIRLPLTITFLLAIMSSTFAADLPPDREAAALEAALAEDPDDGAAWIRLGGLQRIMGYTADARESFARAADALKALPKDRRREMAVPYYMGRAWLEYDATNWQAAMDLGDLAIKYGGGYKARLVKGLAMASVPMNPDVVYDASAFLRPIHDPGPLNRYRNKYWFDIVWYHHNRETWSQDAFVHVGIAQVQHSWGELQCRRDYGYAFESDGHWTNARRFYELSAERSEVSRGAWAHRHDRLAPQQPETADRMPFWTNTAGGYVTGSLMAYTDFACESMLTANHHTDRLRWANHVGDGASRCLAVYANAPRPWLWRALAWQVRGNQARARSDLAQAEFEAIDLADPAFAYAKGREYILKENYGGALPWLESAARELPEMAVCWTDLGVARVMTRDRAGALAAFDRALDIAPDWAAALHNRGMLHLQEGRTDEALADLTRAAEMAPEDQQVVTDLQRAKQLAK